MSFPVLVQGDPSGVIRGWLAEHETHTKRTASTYAAYLIGWKFDPDEMVWKTFPHKGAISFREFLQSQGLDLFDIPAIIAPAAQAWVQLPGNRKNAAVAKSTHNLRLAAVSSFYEYAIRHEVYTGLNPIARVKRHKRKLYSGVKPLPYKDGQVNDMLDAIPTKKDNDLRDKAMLTLTLFTGRRLAEIADLRCGDIDRQSSEWQFTWRHTKGDEPHLNVLPKTCDPIPLLTRWLRRHYGAQPDPAAFVFPSLSRNNYNQRMSAQGIEQRCEKWLGVSTFHKLRHTFSAVYLASGGTVPELMKLLGHSSLAVTTAYAGEIGEGENDKLSAMSKIYEKGLPKKAAG